MIAAAAASLLLLAAQPAPAAPDVPAPLALIDAAIDAGRLESARSLLAAAAAHDTGPALRLRAAEIALAADDLAAAAADFAALRDDPATAAAANQGLGLVRLRQGDLPAAIAALDAAVAADPGLARAWNARGVAADRQRDFPNADAAYARALALTPTATVLTNRGYSLLLRNRPAEAEVDLARAVALDPTLETARNNLRFARALQGRYREAFAGATRDRLAADLNTVGFAAMARGDFASAESYFNRALAQNSHFDPTAWANLQYLKQKTDPLPDRAPDPERK